MKNAASPPSRAMKRASGDAGYGAVAQSMVGAAVRCESVPGSATSLQGEASRRVARRRPRSRATRRPRCGPRRGRPRRAARCRPACRSSTTSPGTSVITLAHEAHELVGVEEHVARARRLAQLAVDPALERAGRSGRRRWSPTGRAGRSRRSPWRATTGRRPSAGRARSRRCRR